MINKRRNDQGQFQWNKIWKGVRVRKIKGEETASPLTDGHAEHEHGEQRELSTSFG